MCSLCAECQFKCSAWIILSDPYTTQWGRVSAIVLIVQIRKVRLREVEGHTGSDEIPFRKFRNREGVI